MHLQVTVNDQTIVVSSADLPEELKQADAELQQDLWTMIYWFGASAVAALVSLLLLLWLERKRLWPKRFTNPETTEAPHENIDKEETAKPTS